MRRIGSRCCACAASGHGAARWDGLLDLAPHCRRAAYDPETVSILRAACLSEPQALVVSFAQRYSIAIPDE